MDRVSRGIRWTEGADEVKRREGVDLQEMDQVRVSIQQSDYGDGVKVDIPKRRLESLDGLRGLAIALMITANYQLEEAFSQIEHAEWNGFTIADAVFPTFMFVMGMAIPLALGSIPVDGALWLQVVRRSVLLWGIGTFLNGFPFADAELASTYRYVGVLQRLGVCYLVLSTLFLISRKFSVVGRVYLRHIFPTSTIILWLLLTYLIEVPGCGRGTITPECSVEGYIDTQVFGMNHNYEGKMHDPEGVLSTLPSLVTCWLGVMFGINLRNRRLDMMDQQSKFRKVAQLLMIGLLLMFLAYALSNLIPMNKNLWTPTYVLMSGGVSVCQLGLLIYLLDILNLAHSPIKPIRVFFRSLIKMGTNPLLLYILSQLIMSSLYAIPVRVKGEPGNPLVLFYTYVLASWLPKSLSSLIFSQLFIWLLFVPLAWFFDGHGWYFRV